MENNKQVEEDTSFLEKCRKRMYTGCSQKDIEFMLGNQTKCIRYEELKNYKTLEELLQPYNSVVFLIPIENSPQIGHFTCMFVMPNTNTLQYFDSYGAFMGKYIKDYDELDESVLTHKKQPIPQYLIKLILASEYKNSTRWSPYPIQSDTLPTAVCGLWCVTRLKNQHMDEEEFAKQYEKIPESFNLLPDLVISAVILKQYPEMTV